MPRWKASAPRAPRTGLGRVPAQPGGAGTRGTLVGTGADVHLDVRLLWQWGKRDSPIVGRIADAAQVSRRETAPLRSSGSAAPPTDLADGWLYRTSRRDGYLY